MRKNNNSLLVTIMGGAIFCFVFLGMAFLFTNNTKVMKGSNSLKNQTPSEEISLGDTVANCAENGNGSCSYYYTTESRVTVGEGTSAPSSCYESIPTASESSPSTLYTECAKNGLSSDPSATIESGPWVWTGTPHVKRQSCTDTCTKCVGGYYLKSSTECAICEAGYACDGSATPEVCPKGTYSSKSSEACTFCTGNQYQDEEGQSSYKLCVDGKVNTEHTSCTPYAKLTCQTVTYDGQEKVIATCNQYCHIASVNGESADLGEYSAKAAGDYVIVAEAEGGENASVKFENGALTSSCTAKITGGVTLESLDGNDDGAYVTPDTSKTYYIHAIGSDGKNMSNVTWTVTASNEAALVSQNCKSGNCIVVVKGWTCACPAPTATITVTAKEEGSTRTASTVIKVTSYGEWREYSWNKAMPSGGTVYTTTALDKPVCRAYGGYQPSTGTYAHYYDRCCCPTPSIPTTPPACYKDSDGGYHWSSSPEASWVVVEGITKEEDCKPTEEEACYIDPTGEYKWGQFAKMDGYTLIESIKEPSLCKKPTEEEACYRKDDDYVWSSTKPEGYTLVEGVTDPKDCAPEETPACYIHGSEYKWGKFAKVKGYILVTYDDGSPVPEEECKTPPTDACYRNKENGEYEWGNYSSDDNYELVADVTEMSQCVPETPVPKADINVSKLVYIFMAILMACGVGFIYYSSIIKKNN